MILHNPTLWIIKSIIFLYYFNFFLKRDLIFTLRNCIFLYFHFPFNWADLFYYIALDATTVSWEGRPNQVLMANISFYLAGKMNSTLAPPRSFFSLDYRHYSAPQCNFKIIYSVIVVKMNIVIWKYYMYYLCIVLLTYLHVNMFISVEQAEAISSIMTKVEMAKDIHSQCHMWKKFHMDGAKSIKTRYNWNCFLDL